MKFPKNYFNCFFTLRAKASGILANEAILAMLKSVFEIMFFTNSWLFYFPVGLFGGDVSAQDFRECCWTRRKTNAEVAYLRSQLEYIYRLLKQKSN